MDSPLWCILIESDSDMTCYHGHIRIINFLDDSDFSNCGPISRYFFAGSQSRYISFDCYKVAREKIS
jgi:hypothetical protein